MINNLRIQISPCEWATQLQRWMNGQQLSFATGSHCEHFVDWTELCYIWSTTCEMMNSHLHMCSNVLKIALHCVLHALMCVIKQTRCTTIVVVICQTMAAPSTISKCQYIIVCGHIGTWIGFKPGHGTLMRRKTHAHSLNKIHQAQPTLQWFADSIEKLVQMSMFHLYLHFHNCIWWQCAKWFQHNLFVTLIVHNYCAKVMSSCRAQCGAHCNVQAQWIN